MTTQDVSNDALHAATEWFVNLTSGEETQEDKKEWQIWLDACSEHKLAWQKIEAVTGQFSGLDRQISIAVLNRPPSAISASQDRRQAIKSLGLFFIVGSASLLAYKKKPWYVLLADYSTGIGEVKHVTLEDGTHLVLNTNTKFSTDFNEQGRNVKLLQGEVYVETVKEELRNYRPFTMTTEHGTITALGTKFSVRIEDRSSRVNVYEDAVEVRPMNGDGDNIIVNAGELVTFTSNEFQQKIAMDLSSLAWTKGFIIVDKMPLSELVTELSRYKTGVLRCDPHIAHLEISGAFPVNDIDAALKSVSKTLSIKVERYSSYWTMLKPV